MLVHIKVIPNARKIQIKDESGILKVYLTAPALEGKANELLIKVLAEYFNTKKSTIEITRGQKSRQKVVSINGV